MIPFPSHISSVQQLHMAGGHHVGQSRYKTCPFLQSPSGHAVLEFKLLDGRDHSKFTSPFLEASRCLEVNEALRKWMDPKWDCGLWDQSIIWSSVFECPVLRFFMKIFQLLIPFQHPKMYQLYKFPGWKLKNDLFWLLLHSSVML